MEGENQTERTQQNIQTVSQYASGLGFQVFMTVGDKGETNGLIVTTVDANETQTEKTQENIQAVFQCASDLGLQVFMTVEDEGKINGLIVTINGISQLTVPDGVEVLSNEPGIVTQSVVQPVQPVQSMQPMQSMPNDPSEFLAGFHAGCAYMQRFIPNMGGYPQWQPQAPPQWQPQPQSQPQPQPHVNLQVKLPVSTPASAPVRANATVASEQHIQNDAVEKIHQTTIVAPIAVLDAQRITYAGKLIEAAIGDGTRPRADRASKSTRGKQDSASRASAKSKKSVEPLPRPNPTMVTAPKMPDGVSSIPVCCRDHAAEEFERPECWQPCIDWEGNPVPRAKYLYSNGAAHASYAQRRAGKGPLTAEFCEGTDVRTCNDPNCHRNHVLHFMKDQTVKDAFRKATSKALLKDAPRSSRGGRGSRGGASRARPRSAINGAGDPLPPFTLLSHIKVVVTEETEGLEEVPAEEPNTEK